MAILRLPKLGFVYRSSMLGLRNGRAFLGEFSDCPFLGAPIIRSFCLQIKKDEQPFAVSYLVNSLGFSQEAAVLATRKNLKFKSPDVPNAVLALLRDHGLNESQISKMVRCRSELLGYDAKAILLPKLEFFYSMGLSRAQIVQMITSKPQLLSHSLKDMIIPWYTFLKSLLCLNEKVIMALKSPSWALCRNVQENFAPNIAFLRDLGMPESRISNLVIRQPRALTVKRKEFEKLVAKIIEMGFDPLHINFINAIILLSGYKISTLEKKKDIYKRYGWSEDDTEMAFKLHPISMFLSEKKIVSGMDFLVRRMGWSPAEIAKAPISLCYSLEKRTIPRCSVVRVLQSKGLIKEDLSLRSILKFPEKEFLHKFVTKFQQDIPELLCLYQGKVAAAELIGKV